MRHYLATSTLQSAYIHISPQPTASTNAIDNPATKPQLNTITSTTIVTIMRMSSNNNNFNLNFRGGSESRDGGAPNRSAKFNLPMMKAMRGDPESRDGG